MTHFVSETCEGEVCGICYRQGKQTPATHKVGEEIPNEWYMAERPLGAEILHNLTQYVCCQHFCEIFSAASASQFRGCELPI